MVLTRRALNRATLARQHLLSRVDMPALDMIGHLVGLQSQAPHAAYYGLWSRLENFAFDDLSQLLVSRQVVRIAAMRSTIHLVTAEDALGLRAFTQEALERDLRNNSIHKAGVAGVDMDEVLAIGRELIEAEPLTAVRLREAFAERWPERDHAALAYAVRCLLPSVQVPPRGLWNTSGPIAHTTAEKWLGRTLSPIDPAALVVRYLAAFGPASVKDMQKWSSVTRLKAVFESLRPELITFRDENGVELFDLPDAPRPGEDAEAPARLVAPFDNLLLSHADRTRVISETDIKRVITNNGIVRGSLLVDGFFVGAWDIERGKEAVITLDLYHPVADTSALEAEAHRLLNDTDPGIPHDVRLRA
ncbi:hypothetical protein Afil01_69090 [Actinorhabdospora filicis]|uniref:Winged helix DNA-binding protein n=1 Tax=Actinorhabdospora filicis TaxID=1785913 RepID=A0A9W6W701_9ACTN|nr:winged helix DNA-binding domain-containing protein [Actinorhabdospora filicis]GLZ82102.1 hypothetical protein Afil01_69090 [Actinorhabdospora filicis]